MCFVAEQANIPCIIWYNVSVENVFVYRNVNACKDMFVSILHTFVKWQVFPLLKKAALIKLTSEIGFHIKYVSAIIVVIQFHVYLSYLIFIPWFSQLPNIYTIVFSVT
jgi:hypothetical protein